MEDSQFHSINNLTERFQVLSDRKKNRLKVVEPLKVIPSWPASMRGTPNACLRSALFAGIQGNERIAYKKRTLLAAVDGIEIRYLGGTTQSIRSGRVDANRAFIQAAIARI